MDDLYQEIIIEEYRHPQHYGALEAPDLTLTERNSSCGDEMQITLKFDADKNILDLKWRGEGCVISKATMSLLSDKILREHTTLQDIKKFQQSDLEELLGIHQISVGREKCLLLGLTALQKL